MKKMLSVALAAALVLGMAGCGGAGAPETAATEAATTATEAAKESETTAAGSTEAQKAPEQSEGGKKAAMIDLFSQVIKLPVPIYPVCNVVAESVAHHTLTVIFCHVVFLAEF